MRIDLTASAIVLHPTEAKVCLIFHRKLQKWMQPGGHIDPGELPCDSALREVKEETGLDCVLSCKRHQNIINNEGILPNPFAQFRQHIPPYGSDEEHIHCDSWYIFDALTDDVVADDSGIQQIGWFSLDDIVSLGDRTFPALVQVVRVLFASDE